MLIKNKKWKNYIFFSLALFITVVFFEVLPRCSSIISLGIDIYNRGIETREAEKNSTMENECATENKKLKYHINNLISNYEENQKISSIISFLDESVYGRGVEIASIKPGKIIIKDNLRLQPMEVNIDSDYEGVFNYIRHLERSSKVILIKELVFTAKKLLNDSLRVKANLEVYLNL